jgi:histidyl-tRNA synthetase
LAQLGKPAKRQCLKIFEDFRKAKIPMAELFSRDSLTAQMKTANRMGADYTLILGQKEMLDKVIIVRAMKTGEQKIVKIEKIVDEMKKRLKK